MAQLTREVDSIELADYVELSTCPIEASPFSHSIVPTQTLEDIPKVSTTSQINTLNDSNIVDKVYQLPQRHNCGKPPDRFSPEVKITKCPITNHVSSHILSLSLNDFVYHMGSVFISTNKVQDA